MIELQINGTPIRGLESLARINVIGPTVAAVYAAPARRLDLTLSGAGAAFPSSPSSGQTFYRTDLEELFAYDGTRSKWLSVRTTEPSYTNQTTVLTGGFLRLFQGNPGTSTLGYRLLWDCTLVGVIAARTTSGAGDSRFDTYANNTSMHQHTIVSADVTSNEDGIDVDFAANDVVNVRAGLDIFGGGHCTAIFRRRAG